MAELTVSATGTVSGVPLALALLLPPRNANKAFQRPFVPATRRRAWVRHETTCVVFGGVS